MTGELTDKLANKWDVVLKSRRGMGEPADRGTGERIDLPDKLNLVSSTVSGRQPRRLARDGPVSSCSVFMLMLLLLLLLMVVGPADSSEQSISTTAGVAVLTG